MLTGPTVPPVPILIPLCAVTRPTASTFVTSLYVRVPAIDTLSLKVAIPETTTPLTKSGAPVPALLVILPTRSLPQYQTFLIHQQWKVLKYQE